METRLAQMPDWAALTIAGCVLVFMDAMLFVILSPYRIVAAGAGVVAVLLGFGVDGLGRRRRPTR
jgi:hypothetical protein